MKGRGFFTVFKKKASELKETPLQFANESLDTGKKNHSAFFFCEQKKTKIPFIRNVMKRANKIISTVTHLKLSSFVWILEQLA